MNAEAVVRARLEAEVGRLLGLLFAEQATATALRAELVELRARLARVQDEIRKGADQ